MRAVRKQFTTEAFTKLKELAGLRLAIDASKELYDRRLTLFVELRNLNVAYADIAEAAGTTPSYVVKQVGPSAQMKAVDEPDQPQQQGDGEP